MRLASTPAFCSTPSATRAPWSPPVLQENTKHLLLSYGQHGSHSAAAPQPTGQSFSQRRPVRVSCCVDSSFGAEHDTTSHRYACDGIAVASRRNSAVARGSGETRRNTE